MQALPTYSFSHTNIFPNLCAILIPLFYLFAYTPLGMDTTDFGYFYGYAWRILNGEMPYRDFAYIKPAFPLYWHALWMWATPERWQILAGKAGFLCVILAYSWLGTLYLNKIFRLPVPAPLLATAAFIFSIHSFPHMPWHTPDGVLFSAASLYLSALGFPIFSGISAACALLCKQSFLLAAPAIFLFIWLYHGPGRALVFALSCAISLFCAFLWLQSHDAWAAFRQMTTGQLDIREAIDAGILIYLRQNWLIPFAAFLPFAIARLLKRRLYAWLSPCYLYLAFLTTWIISQVFTKKEWLGFGDSWPTFFMLLGLIALLFPDRFLVQALRKPRSSALLASAAIGAPLIIAWSTAISGGYKIPAFFALPGIFSFFIFQDWLRFKALPLAWLTILAGLLIFGCAWQYPYVFPARPLAIADLVENAGQIYKKATGVKIDQDMAQRLAELKALRAKYGPSYKTLPGFTLAYYLNDDKPAYGSDWLIDWEINGEIEKFYQELINRKLTVFMERDQLDSAKADNYARAGYGVPQLVRNNWKVVEETPHFVVFQPPEP